MVADSIVNGDKKMSYYREHTHALASGVDAGRVMGELFAKDGGTCRGAGGSMHVYDKDTHFQVRPPPPPNTHTAPHCAMRCSAARFSVMENGRVRCTLRMRLSRTGN